VPAHPREWLTKLAVPYLAIFTTTLPRTSAKVLGLTFFTFFLPAD
jgi:hypothetical protein